VPPPLPSRGAPLPPPPTGSTGRFAPPAVTGSYAGQLTVLYAGERLAVNKDRFIIGRGKQSSDLTIKDPNVSRQHAMIEFLNGQYYMVDMGSTNGVEYNGQRIQRRPISEGDVYRICDHEVGFTYR
jgi:pSer/pThr/pTyr-binding forkhead associated (FHA) protein